MQEFYRQKVTKCVINEVKTPDELLQEGDFDDNPSIKMH